jgi:hypothetical protein
MTTRARQYLNPNDYIIQIWTGATQFEVKELLENKYKVIFSNLDAAYLDHGYGTWLGRDHFWTIKTWQVRLFHVNYTASSFCKNISMKQNRMC